ncbi:RNA-directed DNA polymerase [Melia azedarach]|uniref:RNA-directed DNA polymerase n=1 Tax=Melia azedarach TaxID=155640 RepID=A0ACC1XTY5_MELAZ|nr:RNA-directed DNA polymerase [Melia azedarach]
MTVEVDIPGVPKFSLRAILDTGATVCCVDSKALPKEAIEDNTFEVHFRGINSKQSVNKKMKYGRMSVGGHNFRIPYTYTFPMDLGGKIQFILGCNFIRSMYGGVRLEGNTVTFYKNITAIDTKTVAVLEELEEEDLQLYNLAVLPQKGGEAFERKNRRLIEELKNQGYIGNEPMKYWSKNQVTCKLDIKNPEMVIEDKPLKHVTPAMEEQFRSHIKALIDLKVIRPSKSRHRTTAFMVNSGTTIDPITKKVVHGKERMENKKMSSTGRGRGQWTQRAPGVPPEYSRRNEIPAHQLSNQEYPYFLAYDGLLQQERLQMEGRRGIPLDLSNALTRQRLTSKMRLPREPSLLSVTMQESYLQGGPHQVTSNP